VRQTKHIFLDLPALSPDLQVRCAAGLRLRCWQQLVADKDGGLHSMLCSVGRMAASASAFLSGAACFPVLSPVKLKLERSRSVCSYPAGCLQAYIDRTSALGGWSSNCVQVREEVACTV
jgi:hypothetical protein